MFKRNLRRLFVRFTDGEVKTSVTSSVIWGDFTFRQIGLALCPVLVCCLAVRFFVCGDDNDYSDDRRRQPRRLGAARKRAGQGRRLLRRVAPLGAVCL
jgi:hypothetical protein